MKAELIDYLGTDLTVVNAARVSFNKESEWEEDWNQYDFDNPNFIKEFKDWQKVLINDGQDYYHRKLSEKDEKLIQYLAKHNHFTPFTHCVITMRETVPIFVARQRFKHTVGFSYNEISGRYVRNPPEFYIPEVWRGAPTNKKQGSSDEVITKCKNFVDFTDLNEKASISDVYKRVLEHAASTYNELIESGVAPELARIVLPTSAYTSYYVTGSLAAWARAFKLRIQPDAQKEIQDLAKQWDKIIQPLFPVSWKALVS